MDAAFDELELAATAIGVCDAAIEMTMKQARTRWQGGAYIIEHQAIQLKPGGDLMARVPYVDANSDLYDSTRRMIGRVTNFHRILGHLPETYQWYLPFQFSLQHDDAGSYLTPALRSLAHLATSEANCCAYCSAHNATTALARGIEPAKVAWLDENVDAEPDPDVFDERERLVVLWSRAVTKNEARRAMALFRELESRFSHQQIVELTVITAARTFTNLIQEALWTDHEDDVPPEVEDVPSKQTRAEPREALAQHAEFVARQLGSHRECD